MDMEEAGQSTHKLAILSLNAEPNRSQRYCAVERVWHEVDLACSCAGKGEICPRPYVSITRIPPFNLGSYLTFDFIIK